VNPWTFLAWVLVVLVVVFAATFLGLLIAGAVKALREPDLTDQTVYTSTDTEDS